MIQHWQFECRPEPLLYPPGHPDRSQSLNDLAVYLQAGFRQSGRLLDLDRAIEHAEEGLKLRPPPHPDRAESLNNVALALSDRFEQSGQLIDLNRAIGYSEEALVLRRPGHPNRPFSLNSLASVLWTRFRHLGQLIDLNRAIRHSEEALVLCPPPHPERSASLNNLANVLWTWFGQSGQLLDLDRAIKHNEEALVLPLPHPKRSQSLNNIALALCTRFEQSGQLGQLVDLGRAIEHNGGALLLGSPPHPDRASYVSNLAHVLWTRFEILGQSIDLDRAIEHNEEAMVLHPPGHPNRPSSLHNLGNALLARFKQRGQLVDLDRAVEQYEKAATLCLPGHPHRADCLNYLAVALRSRFVQSGKLIDLEESIEHNEQALALRPPGHPLRPESLDNLASALQARFGQSGMSLDLDNAISCCRQALQCTPDSLRAGIHVHLGDLHRSGSHPHLDLSLAEYSRGARFEFGTPSDRFVAAMRWIEYSTLSDPSPSSDGSAAYAVAIDLLPQLFWLGLDPSSRLQALRCAPMLGCDAAAWAIRSGEFCRAVELLEQGRAVFWAHTLRIQNPFDRLPDELGMRLRKLSRQLQVSDAVTSTSSMSASETYRRRKLQTDWTNTVEDVRKLAGFEHFLRAPPFSQLVKAANNGPVVMVIASVHGCSALVVKQGCKTPHNIPFDIDYGDAKNLNGRLTRVLKALGVSRFRGESSGNVAQTMEPSNEEKELSRILVALWDEVVEPVIDYLELTPSPHPPRLWWCPTGPFAFLPLHAATKGNRSTAQFIVSSYIPTLEALAVAQSSTTIVTNPKLVVVIQPEVKGLPVLTHTMEESRRIAAAVPPEFMLNVDGSRRHFNQEPESPEVGTVQNVLDRLGEASIVHLACHGRQDSMMPLESALFLHDGKLTISRMQSIHRALSASFAFLSACESARGDENQPDEAIHLAAAMLSVGFQGTVATMWPMGDVDGPVIAEAFYKELFIDRSFDSSHTAYALHEAVKHLRNTKVSPSRWLPFIHVHQENPKLLY